MLNPFGTLLAFGLVAPFILRIILGVIFVGFGYKKAYGAKKDIVPEIPGFNKKTIKIWSSIIALIEIIIGLLFILGLFTQISAILGAIISLGAFILKIKYGHLIKNSALIYILLLSISFSLLFSGAGFWAIDLPL